MPSLQREGLSRIKSCFASCLVIKRNPAVKLTHGGEGRRVRCCGFDPMRCGASGPGVRLGKSSSQPAVEAQENEDGVLRQGLDTPGEGRSASGYLTLRLGAPCCPTGAREGSHAGADTLVFAVLLLPVSATPKTGLEPEQASPQYEGPHLYLTLSSHLRSPCIRSPPA